MVLPDSDTKCRAGPPEPFLFALCKAVRIESFLEVLPVV